MGLTGPQPATNRRVPGAKSPALEEGWLEVRDASGEGLCHTSGEGALLRNTEKPGGRGGQRCAARPVPWLPQRTTPGMQSASRTPLCACALPAARCPLGLVVRGGLGRRRLALVGCAGRCGVAVPSRFTCLSQSFLLGFPDVPCLPLPYSPTCSFPASRPDGSC